MKSSAVQLASRGFLPDEAFAEYENLSEEEAVLLTASAKPHERTAGIMLLARTGNTRYLPEFCRLLAAEKKLYTKLALCDALVRFGDNAIPFLLPLLGAIGGNQHKKAGLVDIGKTSFPLPRDIAARVLIRIGPSVLPFMKTILEEGSYAQKCEALDVIGHIAYHNYDDSCSDVLVREYQRSIADDLIRWKCVRAFQSFQSEAVKTILKNVLLSDPHPVIRKEAERSLERMTNRKK